MIGLSYLYDFVNKNELIFIINCSDKVIETIDIMYYETDYEQLDMYYEEDYKIQFNCIEMIKTGKDIAKLRKYNQLGRLIPNQLQPTFRRPLLYCVQPPLHLRQSHQPDIAYRKDGRLE